MNKKIKKGKKIDSYTHEDKERKNNPTIGLVDSQTDPDKGESKTYAFDPHIDPQLDWASKAEHTSFEVPVQSLHVHERIEACTIIEALRTREGDDHLQRPLFEDIRDIPLQQEIQFYQHSQNWTNRLIAGDSLLVMNSLLTKESMKEKVQCVYIDPPFGISYSSNFQPFTNKKEVKDGDDKDLSQEPEMIKAFRDTWKLGIHSYLSYLRDRILLARELLTTSGSIFIQIGDENVHRVSLILDEIFGMHNRVATITFTSTASSSSRTISEVSQYILWYAKDKNKAKYHQLYEPLQRSEMIDFFSYHALVETEDGVCRKLTKKEAFDPDSELPEGARLLQRARLTSQGTSTTGRSEPYEWNGTIYPCPDNSQWSISKEGMDILAQNNRLVSLTSQDTLSWKRYEDEVPGRTIHNVWAKTMAAKNKTYVVQTAEKVIQRCLLMATDPGDLVFDPTCGSGTTAFVAEQWGRRWITCDSSRVALAVAKQRLLTSSFDYYSLRHPTEGVQSGFIYKTVPYVSAATLAGAKVDKDIYLFDDPEIDKKRTRVTGPFTVEAVPAPVVQPIDTATVSQTSSENASLARSGESIRHAEWCQELLQTGIRGNNGQRIMFSRVDIKPYNWLHAEAETKPANGNNNHKNSNRTYGSTTNQDSMKKQGAGSVNEPATDSIIRRAVIAFGPEHGSLGIREVNNALDEVRKIKEKPELIIFAAFQFDSEAAKTIDELKWDGFSFLKTDMSMDLQTMDLKKRNTGRDCFWLIGQPDIEVEKVDAKKKDGDEIWKVSVKGFDYFNTNNGEIETGGKDKIAIWMLDTDYDGRCLYPRQVFFPIDDKERWKKLAKTLNGDINIELAKKYHGTVSLPFTLGKYRKIAVKIIDNRGIESMKVISK